MRALIQRVTHGSVMVNGEIAGAIDYGFVVLLGVTHADGAMEASWIADKIAGLRVFEDDAGKMNLSLSDVGGAVLLISQFTLYADASRGRRPSFTDAAPPEVAEPLVDAVAERLRDHNLRVETGVFGAHMSVAIHNDGPVTIMIERE